MERIQEVPGRGRTIVSRRLAISALSTAVAGVAIMVGLVFSALRPAGAASHTVPMGDLVDGWSSGAADIHARGTAHLQDGYLPGLVSSRLTDEPIDGYLAGLLAFQRARDLAAGGAVTHTVVSGEPRDGWEPALLP